METNVGIVILAAGAARRMRAAKQLLEYRGRSLIRRAAETAVNSNCRPAVAVLGERAGQIKAQIADLPVETVVNERWADGLGTSIGAGVESLAAEAEKIEAVIVMLCDQPLISSEQINSLVEIYKRGGCTIVASSYGATFGVPALFGREHFAELTALEGDAGAKSVIKKHLAETRFVENPAAAVDVDTPEDFRRLSESSRL